MSLLDVVRAGVALANTITQPLQATVVYERRLTSDDQGTGAFAAPVNLKAIVDWKQKQIRTPTGELSVSRSYVMFLDIVALVAATGGEGINDQDLITLPDGTTGPILDMSGFIDAGTGHPVATELWLG
jgi:hypothetical protein